MARGRSKKAEALTATIQHPPQEVTISLREFLSRDRRGCLWVLGCIAAGALLGFIVGAGWLESQVKPWRHDFGANLRATTPYKVVTLEENVWLGVLGGLGEWAASMERKLEVERYANNPAHPRVFAVLREAIIREKGGFVHPDLGFMVPAPCGAARGIGMVLELYHACQSRCLPGIAAEKATVKTEREAYRKQNATYPMPTENDVTYHQEEILIRVPLQFQMTRTVALDTLLPLIPAEVQKSAGIQDLDDAALLALLLAHERGVGRYSRWSAYVASLPREPTCGYSERLRPFMLDAIAAYRKEVRVQAHGWAEELQRATTYANKITSGLSKDYGSYLKTPTGKSAEENIAWALCQVTSRATAGLEQYGDLRLVPLIDQINHFDEVNGFEELTGNEKLDNGDLLDATEADGGAFIVRSARHGQRKHLGLGQELMANYNIPHYTPLDWFVTLGFVPPEKQTPWRRVDPILPQPKVMDKHIAPRHSVARPQDTKNTIDPVRRDRQHTEL